ncbi:MAG TPA: acyltransferase [Panacibacter sp.]|nr:acyltransferase [Panacibacter sp.]HNP45781.1 acyltransferase [Panacibacter sp.]
MPHFTIPNPFKKRKPLRIAEPQTQITKHDWFPGLNALRFIAAALVIIMHVHNNQGIAGLPQLPAFPVLFKGLYAVSFFFVLSGFLITFLLLKENNKTGTISIRNFYLRRVFRIWPLYFIVIAAGAFFYWQLVPQLGLKYDDNYSHALAITLYSFFLANVMNSIYHVGGILHVTWSVAVEEQFYLFWAPLSKRFIKKLPVLIAVVSLFSLAVNIVNTLNVFHYPDEVKQVISTLQFHYMGIGAGFAWLVFHHKKQLLALKVFSNRMLQAGLTILIIGFFLFYQKTVLGEVLIPLPLGLLFGWLIVNVSVNEKRIFTLEHPVLHYLGKVSYGIYMYHMFVVYAVSFLFAKVTVLQSVPVVYFMSFYGLVFLVATGLASLSYYIIELPVLGLNKVFTKKPDSKLVLKAA